MEHRKNKLNKLNFKMDFIKILYVKIYKFINFCCCNNFITFHIFNFIKFIKFSKNINMKNTKIFK